MGLYAFELGRKKNLSLHELFAVLGDGKYKCAAAECAIFELDEFDPQALQDKLGGTIKIIKILDNIDFAKSKNFQKNLFEKIRKLLISNFKGHVGKVPFAVSSYGLQIPNEINIKELLNFSKKILKSLFLNSRFVNQGMLPAKSSAIYLSKAIERGVDLCILKSQSTVYLGRSISIQDIDNYSIRDFEKPKRDARVGMLPPKLAQIMINLAGETNTIFDPFCGTGTVLAEGLLMNKKTIGSDIEKKMIEYSKENLEWLCNGYNIGKNYKLFEKDARQISEKDIANDDIDAIITEGYLGRPQLHPPLEAEQEIIFRELSNLHVNWLTNINKITKTSCKIVMCVAAFFINGKITHLPRFEEIATLAGYKVIETFTYERKDQIVVRDIKVLEKITA
jgi:tRNA (guanine10-N2)-dimethyltransferase